MSHLAASNADEPPRKTNHPPSSSLSSPSLFSLPLDIVLNVLARVPKRYYPILCCVSKNLRSLFRSPEIQENRSLLGKDSVYICFMDGTYRFIYDNWYAAYALRRTENSTTENLFDSIDDFSYPPEPFLSSHMIAVGPEIFLNPGCDTPSSSLWIRDTRSEELRQGPRLLVTRRYNSVGLVGGKIYVIGGCRDGDIPAERFDLKTQTWEAAPTPDEKESCIWKYGVNVTLDRKVYALCNREVTTYDTRDGSCQRSEMLNDEWLATGKCVIDNVLYVYFSRFRLMWYDSKLMLCRVVYGLDLGKPQGVAMAEYYGKLAFIWEEEKRSTVSSEESKGIWCRMIVLLRSDVGIHGTSEPSQLLGTVPHGYEMCHCLSLSG
ncbi:PREDICTED: F-box/kelch-repeat protein At2g44700-like [Camelina sativa]|uniref:F-box/kelch-repeat protein At2g44700-like n=1 Tax=Camelina sativa TaxID=90675 RepID=A0ABM0SLK0_CAMSA|nr:PREDICTED: F-box/kelch-repeat protein At2g44700-like [Camelina sativa]